MEEKFKKVYTKKLAYELRRMGHKIVRTQANPKKPNLDVYIFREDERFQEDFQVAVERTRNPVAQRKRELIKNIDNLSQDEMKELLNLTYHFEK